MYIFRDALHDFDPFKMWTSADPPTPVPVKRIRLRKASDVSEVDQEKWRIAIREFISDPKKIKQEMQESILQIKVASGVTLTFRGLRKFIDGGSLYNLPDDCYRHAPDA